MTEKIDTLPLGDLPEGTGMTRQSRSVELAHYPTDSLVTEAIDDLHIYKQGSNLDPSQFNQAKEVATIFPTGSLAKDQKIKLSHLGYVVVSVPLYDVWQRSQGSMRGTMTTEISQGYVILHGKNETINDIFAKVNDLEIQEVPDYLPEAEEAPSENVYEARGSSGTVWIVKPKA